MQSVIQVIDQICVAYKADGLDSTRLDLHIMLYVI